MCSLSKDTAIASAKVFPETLVLVAGTTPYADELKNYDAQAKNITWPGTVSTPRWWGVGRV